MTEKWRYCLCPEDGQTFAWLGWPGKMAVPSSVGDVNSFPNECFRAKYIDTQIKCFLLWFLNRTRLQDGFKQRFRAIVIHSLSPFSKIAIWKRIVSTTFTSNFRPSYKKMKLSFSETTKSYCTLVTIRLHNGGVNICNCFLQITIAIEKLLLEGCRILNS